MSELSTISKAFFVLGTIAVLAVMIFGSSGPTLSPNPSAPTFINPFDLRGYSSSSILTQGGRFQNISIVSTVSGNQCGNITYQNCLVDRSGPDYDNSYIRLNAANVSQFNFSAGIYPDFYAWIGIYNQGADWTRFKSFSVQLWCRWETTPSNGNRSVAVIFSQILDSRNAAVFGANDNETCPLGNWGQVTFVSTFAPGGPSDANAIMNMIIDTEFFTPDGILDISTAYIQIFFNGNIQCTGNGFFVDLSCQWANFGNNIIDFANLLKNVILWILAWAGFAVTFFLNFITIIVWLYSIPGMPSSVQLFVSSYITGIFGIIIISLVKLLRGGSP